MLVWSIESPPVRSLPADRHRKYKNFKLVGLHPICAFMFAGGYALRAYQASGTNYMYSVDNSQSLIIFVVSQVLIYIAPWVHLEGICLQGMRDEMKADPVVQPHA